MTGTDSQSSIREFSDADVPLPGDSSDGKLGSTSPIDHALIPDQDYTDEMFPLGEADPAEFDFESKEARYYMAHYSVENEESTTKGQKGRMNKYLHFLNAIEVDDPLHATDNDIRSFFVYLNQENRAETTMGHYRSAIKQFHEFVEAKDQFDDPVTKSHIIKQIDCSNIADKKHTFEREPITRDEVELLYDAAKCVRNELMARVMYEMGLRNSEVRKLKISDIDWEKKTIFVGERKNDKSDEIPVRMALLIRLEDFIERGRKSYQDSEDHEYIFPSREGGYLSAHAVGRAIKKMARNAGIQEVIATIPAPANQNYDEREIKRVTPHTLRHSIVTHLVNRNLPKDIVKYLTGHTSDAIDDYIHEDVSSAKDILRMNIH